MTNFVEGWVKFVKGHEKIAIAVLVAVLGYWTACRALGAWERHDEKVTARQAMVSAADAQAAAQKGQENAALLQELAALRQQVDATNARLDAETAARDRANQAQKQADAGLAAADLEARWAQLAQLPTGAVRNTENLFTVTPDAAVKTVQALEDVPTLRGDLAATNTEKANLAGELAKSTDAITQLNVQIALDKTASASAAKLCADQVKLANDRARHGKLKWFGIGYVAGFGSAVILKSFVTVFQL